MKTNYQRKNFPCQLANFVIWLAFVFNICMYVCYYYPKAVSYFECVPSAVTLSFTRELHYNFYGHVRKPPDPYGHFVVSMCF